MKPHSGLVERLLTERIGLDPLSLGESQIGRGVETRMMALGIHSRAEYEWALLEEEDEFQALVEEIVVPESWFFRDGRPFQVLADFARAHWLTDPNRPPLTVLSIPCAGGEEPYSIAMTLVECGLTSQRFQIDAVDISCRVVARAVSGVFSSNSFRRPDSSIHSIYFREENGSFRIDPTIRESVQFHIGNLLASTLFADRPPFDVVFCRNVLIYLGDQARRQVCANLCRLVADRGLLFLGHADRLEQSEGGLFKPMEDKGSFAYLKEVTQAKKAKTTAETSAPLSLQRRNAATSGSLTLREKDVALPLVSKTGSIERQPTVDAPHPGPSPGGEGARVKKVIPAEPCVSIVDHASSLADQGRYDEALAMAEGFIRDGGVDARVFFLLGMIAEAAGGLDRAEAYFLKAVYLDPQHDEALLALALLVGRRGDLAAEASYRRRAERVRARKAVS